MELYLFRHGEAEAVGAAGDDARELTEKGVRDVRAVGEVLLRAGIKPEAIWTSPLLRARQTGQVLQAVFGVAAQAEDRLRPGTTLGGLQELLGGIVHGSVMLVGHEPDLSGLVHQLTGGGVRMRTSGVVRVDLDQIEPGQGVLVWLASPDLLDLP